MTDNGNGIEAEHHYRVMRFGYTTKADKNGYGLHTVGNFVSSVGGKVRLHSAGAGQGAQVTLLLPLKD